MVLLGVSTCLFYVFQVNLLCLRCFTFAGNPFPRQANRIQEMGKFLEMIQIFGQVGHRLSCFCVRSIDFQEWESMRKTVYEIGGYCILHGALGSIYLNNYQKRTCRSVIAWKKQLGSLKHIRIVHHTRMGINGSVWSPCSRSRKHAGIVIWI